MLVANEWQEYELIDSGSGEKLERFGKYTLRRPDPQAIWPAPEWERADMRYRRATTGGGRWQTAIQIPRRWPIRLEMAGLPIQAMWVEPTGFKHTGIFPEQAVNWRRIMELIKAQKRAGQQSRIINLFGYTGGATVAAALGGADEILHVDAAKAMNQRAMDNLKLSGQSEAYVRFFTDDVLKVVGRELRRGRKYSGIILDPPAYGRGPNGELWRLEDTLFELLQQCAALLDETEGSFIILNTYTTSFAAGALKALVEFAVPVDARSYWHIDELGLVATMRTHVLPCGMTALYLRK